MNRFFVYYYDDYPDNGGQGFISFPTVEEAEAFVFKRMKSAYFVDPIYSVIEGIELQRETVRVIEQIRYTRPPKGP